MRASFLVFQSPGESILGVRSAVRWMAKDLIRHTRMLLLTTRAAEDFEAVLGRVRRGHEVLFLLIVRGKRSPGIAVWFSAVPQSSPALSVRH